jgi:DNA-binding MarR family transcriptional regulator
VLERAPTANGSAELAPAHSVATGLAKLGLVLRHHAWQEREGSGLTPTQGQILAALHARSEPLTVGELAAELGVRSATISDSLATLVAKGHAVKGPSPRHPRAVAVRLTAKGRRAAARAAAWPDVLLAALDALEPAEQGVLARALTKMIRELQERGEIPVARMCASCRFFRPDAHDDALRPHHCAFVDAPFGDRELRLDCADQQPLPPTEAAALWAAFERSTPATPRRSP